MKENSIYGGTSFWMLNDKLEDEDLVFQIKEMHDKGIYAFIARTYIGLKSDYPGENFMSKIELILNTAKEYGMKVYLQALYMPEAIPSLDEKDALDFLVAQSSDFENGEELLMSKDGVNYGRFNSQTFLNIFDETAIEYYIEKSYGIWNRFKEHFGKTVLSVWVDEPSYSGEYLPYPKCIEKAFFERFGYSLRDNIHKLYCDDDNYGVVRWQYRTLLQDMMEKAYFAKIREWCDQNGLWFSGHLMMEETISSQLTRASATMPFYKYFNLPGIDVLCAQLNWRDDEIKPTEIDNPHSVRPVTLTTALQLASAAAQAGQKYMLCEMYGCSSQNLNFRDQKHIFDIYAAHGINHRAIHGTFYSLAGRRKRAYPPHINYYQPYWDEYGKLSEAIVNTSNFVTQGKRSSKVLVLHPMGSGSALYAGKIDDKTTAKSHAQLNRLDTKFIDLLSNLTAAHIQFDLGDERTIERDGCIDNGILKIGQCQYDTIVMPYIRYIRSSTADTITRFAEQGGKVFALECKVEYADGLPFCFDADVIAFESTNKLTARLKADDDLLVVGDGAQNIRILKKETSEGYNCFVLNFDCSRSVNTILHLKGIYSPHTTDCLTGQTEHLSATYNDNETVIPLKIEAGSSIMLTLIRNSSGQSIQKPTSPAVTVDLKQAWHTQRVGDNVMLLEFCRFKKGDEEFSDTIPILALQDIMVAENYHGPLLIEYEFESLIDFEGAKLATEEMNYEWIEFNGQRISHCYDGYYLAKQFKTLPLPKIIKGKNKVVFKLNNYVPLARAKKSINSLFENQKGDELECCYIVGDFSVKADCQPCLTGNKRYSGFAIDAPNLNTLNELTCCGYPFFAGKAEMVQTVSIDVESAKRVLLHFDHISAACATVKVNGKECRTLMWAPYCCDITHLVKSGENTISVTLSSTLRNLLGPYHRPHGEIGNLFGGGYKNPNLAWNGTDKQNTDPKWYEHRIPDTKHWSESYMQTKFGVDGGKIIIEY